MAEDDKLRFFVSVMNRTPKPILDVRIGGLDFGAMSITSRSWCGANDPQCDLVAGRLGAGESILLSGEILASTAHEKRTLIVLVAWHDEASQQQLGDFVQLGDITVQGWGERWRSSWTYDLLKDLTLPIVLIGLGTALGLYDKNRESGRQRLERELDEKRRQDSERRAQAAQTWTSMLPAAHELATQHYMPIDAAARSAIDEITEREKAIQKSDEAAQRAAEDRAFYYLLLMLRRLRALADEKGGFYFKDRVGEELVTTCYENFRLKFLREPPEAERKLSLSIGLLNPHEKLGTFAAKVEVGDSNGVMLKEVRRFFDEWLRSSIYQDAVRNLRAMRLLLSCELNRPYEHWYGRIDRVSVDLEIERTIASVAGEIEALSENRGFRDRALEYLKQLQGGV